ncbi:MAG: type II toxin-antitoxin system Phd/YefM family antitoxin [Thermoleophilia bacterium]|nr:type II toxin-antitoxin system Phd/YefM family antitoxin [Thermoleophilia bacterium]
MRRVSIREMRGALPGLEELVQREGELVITRRGRPIARMVPFERTRPMPSHADLRSTMRRLEVPSENLIREDRDNG